MQIFFSSFSPLQEAVAAGLETADEHNFWSQSKCDMKKRVDHFVTIWEELGLQYFKPDGGYYIVVNMGRIRIPAEYDIPTERGIFSHDFHLCWFLVKAIGVAAIPVSIFYRPENSHMAANLVRFSVAKEDNDLNEAMYRLRALKGYMHQM